MNFKKSFTSKTAINIVLIVVVFISIAQAQTTVSGIENSVLGLKSDTLAKADTLPKPVIKSTLYVEVGGNALHYSLNYEKVLNKNPKYTWALRVGFGANPISKETYYPLELNYYRGKKCNFFELGIGFTPSIATWKDVNFGGTLERNFQGITTLRVGYRYISPNQRFVFRAGALLLWRSVFVTEHQDRIFFYEKRDYYDKATIFDGIGESIVPWLGVSVGYNLFK